MVYIWRFLKKCKGTEKGKDMDQIKLMQGKRKSIITVLQRNCFIVETRELKEDEQQYQTELKYICG